MANQLKASQILRMQRYFRQNGIEGMFYFTPFFDGDKLTHILATREEINIRGVEDLKSVNSVLPDDMSDFNKKYDYDESPGESSIFDVKSNIMLVKGYLYDYPNDIFVSAPLRKASYGKSEYGSVKEYLFCIYDSGVPNLIFDECSGSYYVISQYGKGMYSFIECAQTPTVYSHLSRNGNLKRIIFTCRPNWDRGGFVSNLLIVLSRTNQILDITSHIISTTPIFAKGDKLGSNKDYLNYLYGDCEVTKNNSNEYVIYEMHDLPEVTYLFDTDFLFIKSYSGKYGNYVLFCPSFMNKVDFEYSMTKYKIDKNNKLQDREIRIFAGLGINDFEVELAIVIVASSIVYYNKIKANNISNYCCEYRERL